MTRVEKRLAALEQTVEELRQELEYQRAVEGIRRGLESADRGEGLSLTKAFAKIRRKTAS